MASPSEPISISNKFAAVAGFWSPHIVAEFNGLHVKLARAHGEFAWHSHPETDEVFFIHRGSLTIEIRDRPPVELHTGDLFVVPAGVEHRPVAADECQLLLIEPAGTPNTGDTATAAEELWI